MESYKAAIFDLDGTLLDSMWVWDRLLIDYLAEYGHEVYPEILNEVTYMTIQQSSKYIKEQYELPVEAEQIMRQWRDMVLEYYQSKIPMKAGAKKFLKRLYDDGVKLAVATSCMNELCEAALKAHGIYDWFDVIVYSDEVGKSKDYPDIYLECAKRMGVEITDCMLFEDILTAVHTAHSIGLRVTVIEDEFSGAEQEALKLEADFYARDFTEL